MSNLSGLQSFKQRLAHTKAPVSLGPFWSFLRTLAEDIGQTNLLIHASSMAYMTLGSIIPLLALTFAIVSAFQPIAVADADWLTTFKILILENLAPQSAENMVRVLETFLANLDVAKIGLTGFLTLTVLIILLLRDIEVTLNSIWQVPQTRSFVKRFMFFWITTTLGALCLSIVFAAFSRVYFFDKVSMDDLLEKLTHETREWMRSRPAELSVNPESLLKNAFVSLGLEGHPPSLAALLESAASVKTFATCQRP
jgi:YihY family inner membrane protein